MSHDPGHKCYPLQDPVIGHMSIACWLSTLHRPSPGIIFTGSRVTPSEILYLRSHIYSLQGEPYPQTLSEGNHPVSQETPTSRPYPLGLKSTFSRVTLSPIPCTLGHISTVSKVTSPPRPFTWGHMCTLSRLSATPRPCTWAKSPQSQG